MKNNKGFAISTALYGLLMVLIIVLMLILQIVRTTNNNNKGIADIVQEKLSTCEQYRKMYNECTTDESCEIFFNLNQICMENEKALNNAVKIGKANELTTYVDEYIDGKTSYSFIYTYFSLLNNHSEVLKNESCDCYINNYKTARLYKQVKQNVVNLCAEHSDVFNTTCTGGKPTDTGVCATYINDYFGCSKINGCPVQKNILTFCLEYPNAFENDKCTSELEEYKNCTGSCSSQNLVSCLLKNK